jgi:hypothetical protein
VQAVRDEGRPPRRAAHRPGAAGLPSSASRHSRRLIPGGRDSQSGSISRGTASTRLRRAGEHHPRLSVRLRGGDAVPQLADLIRTPISLIVAGGGPLALAAKDATRTIPIVFVAAGDPVDFGIVASLAHPGSTE